jgi:phenylacetate-CoA ligase
VIFQPDLETMPRSELEQLQRTRLRERFGVELESLAEQPFTTKADLRDAYPFGMVRVSRDECVRIHASSGTRGKATIVAYTANDLSLWADCCARAIADHVEDAGRLKLRAGLFGAEPWTERMRGAIEEALNICAVDVYGLSEIVGPGVAAECLEGLGGAHVNEDHFLVETIDPETGAPASEGELVFTTLTKEAMPLLRYRTGDLASVTREPCSCGRTFARMSRVKGRTDDMLVIRGVNVFPSEIERVLLAVEGLQPHYQLVVERNDRLDELTVQVEGAIDAAPVRAQLERALGLSARVEIVEPGSIPRSEGKALRVLDRRSD